MQPLRVAIFIVILQAGLSGLLLSFNLHRFGTGRPYDDIMRRMNGEFDNSLQCSSYTGETTWDMGPRKSLMLHEFVTAVFMKHPSYQNAVLCSYFYGKNSSDVFRFRLYEFKNDRLGRFLGKRKSSDATEVIMKIYRPSKKCEDALRRNLYDLTKWMPRKEDFELLKGCDVRWMRIGYQDCYQGDLVEGCCYVCSQSNPNLRLMVKDDLKLWSNELWINDRVYLPSGKLIIGNDKNIPYKLQRVQLIAKTS